MDTNDEKHFAKLDASLELTKLMDAAWSAALIATGCVACASLAIKQHVALLAQGERSAIKCSDQEAMDKYFGYVEAGPITPELEEEMKKLIPTVGPDGTRLSCERCEAPEDPTKIRFFKHNSDELL
jgi:hypothetical protein